MAALVRAAQFCRVLPSFLPKLKQNSTFNPVLTRRWSPANKLGFRGLGTQAEAAERVRKVAPPKNALVNRQMINVETNIHRYGRVTRSQLDGFLSEITKIGEVTSPQALLALRSMGAMLYDEPPSKRVELVQQTWDSFEKLGLDFEVTHYNALLRTFLQNKHTFSPSTFLESMEKKQVQPNRVTFQNLISQYCEKGDIAGASQVLEYMKELDLPIGEQVFNSLITGHFRANEPENAEGILDIMRKAGMEPTVETYVTLLSGYVEKGQVEKIDQILETSENESVLLRPYHLLRIIYELTINNQKDAIPNILDKLGSYSGINQDAISWINQLICQGHEDVAYQIFSIMPKPVAKELENLTLGRFFIRALVKNERPVDLVCRYTNEMRNQGFNNDTINFAASLAFLNKRTDYALELIGKMESEGLPVRLHYFWPALTQYAKAGNKEGYTKTLQTIMNMMGQEEGMSLTFHEYIIPGMNKLGYSYEEGMQTLKDVGFSEHDINFAYFISLIETKGIPEAIEFAKGKPMSVIMGAVRPYLIRRYKETKDWKSVIELLSLSESLLAPRKMLSDLAGDWLGLVVQSREWETVEAVVDEMIAKKININKQFYQSVNKKKIPEAIEEKIQMLLEDSKEVSMNRLPIADMTTAELTDLANRTGNKTAKKWLLVRHCATGNVEAAENLKAALDAEGFLCPPLVVRQLFFLNALHKKDEQGAMEYLNQLQSQYPEYADYARALINLASVLTENGKVTDAIDMLKTYSETHSDHMKEQKYSSSYFLENDCMALLKAAIKTHEPTIAKQVLESIFSLGYMKPATYSLVQGLMEGYIERNNPDYCIELLEWLITEYKRAPCIDGLLQMFIKAEDPEKLQKVMDLVIPIHGEMNLLHQLMINLVECGHLKKARKILETPGLRASMIRLRIGCENFVNNDKITELEQLVEITKDMFSLDRDDMLFQLIRGYVKVGDFKKAQDVLIQYEEEGLSPSGRTLRYLAKAMKGAGLEISFEVPQIYNEKLAEAMSVEDEILRHVQENRLRTAKDMIRKMKATGECPADLLLKIAEFLCKVNKPNDVGWVMQTLADSGDVETLLLLKAKNIVPNPDILNKCVFTAYANSNRTEELISHMNENLDSAGSFVSVRGLTAIANSSPDKLPQFEELAEKCSEQNQRSILWPLWQTYFYIDPQCPKASAVLQKQPALLAQTSVLGLCQKSVRDNRLDVLTEMESLFHQKEQTVAFVRSHIIQLHAKKGDVESVLSEIEKLKDVDLTTTLRRDTQRDVEKLLTLNNRPIPWEKKAAADSSSSSDSSLDEDTAVKGDSR